MSIWDSSSRVLWHSLSTVVRRHTPLRRLAGARERDEAEDTVITMKDPAKLCGVAAQKKRKHAMFFTVAFFTIVKNRDSRRICWVNRGGRQLEMSSFR